MFYTRGLYNFPQINQLRTSASLFTSSISPLNYTIFFCAVSEGPFCRGLNRTAEYYGKWHGWGVKLLLQKEMLKPSFRQDFKKTRDYIVDCVIHSD